MPKNRPYLYYDQTVSLCVHCLRRIEAKHVFQDDKVWLDKWCPEHGRSRVLISTDIPFWRSGREVYVKAPEMPLRFNTQSLWGCPYDCGLCPDHMQHSCLTVIEITDYCNLSCPVCYASSGPDKPHHRTMEEIERMLDAVVANEGQPDVVQISGGEPTEHPLFWQIMEAARKRPIRHLMLNTNGVRIAREAGFAEKLATFAPGFEVYLQFDSLRKEPLVTLRGVDLRQVREKALAALNEAGVSTTLVMTVAKGINDDEIGAVVEFAASQPCVRGVTLQPIQFAGRIKGLDSKRQRLTQSEVRSALLEQSAMFTPQDIIPVPCNPDALSMGYALKTPLGIMPLTRYVEPEVLLAGTRNTIVFEADQLLKDQVFKLFSTNHSPESQTNSIKDLLCCLPKVQVPEELTYQNVFRVLIMSFMDAESFDVRAMKKSCVHIARPDGRIVPFESFNILYRDPDSPHLQLRRDEVDVMFGRGKNNVHL